MSFDNDNQLAGWQHPRYGLIGLNPHMPQQPPIRPNDPDWRPVYKVIEEASSSDQSDDVQESLEDIKNSMASTAEELLKTYEDFKRSQLPLATQPHKLGFFEKSGLKLDEWIAKHVKQFRD